MPGTVPTSKGVDLDGLHAFIAAMPKVELHVHLEGSIRPATLLTLAERNGVPLPATDLEGLRDFYRFTDFDHFIRVYFTISGCLKTVDDYALIAYEFGADMARQNVRYAEVMVSAFQYYNRGIDLGEVVQGAMAGFKQAERERVPS